MTITTKAARDAALHDLDSRYGKAYDLAVTRAGWIAKHLDNNRALVAASPEELRRKIEADAGASPGPAHRASLPPPTGRRRRGRSLRCGGDGRGAATDAALEHSFVAGRFRRAEPRGGGRADPGDDVPVWTIGTHLPASDAEDRARALSRFAALLRNLDGPWLACGDFNTRPSGWLDELPGVTFCPNPPKPTHPARRAVRPIDYCLASPGVQAEARVLRAAGSDHRAVLVTARVPGAASEPGRGMPGADEALDGRRMRGTGGRPPGRTGPDVRRRGRTRWLLPRRRSR